MKKRVVAALEDLLFRSKISETAETLNARENVDSRVETAFPRSPKKLREVLRDSPPELLILDLNSSRFEPLELLKELGEDEGLREIPTIGFLSHVQKDLAVAAKELGCDRVVARSAFVKELPEILAESKNVG